MSTDRDPVAAQRLNTAMDARRTELRLRWTQVAQRAGMTPRNLERIRKGETAITPFTAVAIERALEWAEGGVEAALAGAEPMLAGSAESELSAELSAAWEDFKVRSKSRGAESALKVLRKDLDRIESEHERARQMQRSMRDESDAG